MAWTLLVAARRQARRGAAVVALGGLVLTAGCGPATDDRRTLHMLIESSPNNLDLRQGTDAQSERVGGLLFEALAKKDDHFNLIPWLATSWERPDPQSWVFHLRPNVRFHDGHPLTAEDVAWSIESMTNGSLVTAKGGAFRGIDRLSVTAPLTVLVHTKTPDNGLLFNMSDGLWGVVEKGAGAEEGLHPVGTGPFRFVSQVQDKEVVLERNPGYWRGAPKIERVRFEVVPDTITAALEMKKGSADLESNVLSEDMVHALTGLPHLKVESAPGAAVIYANFNTADPVLRDARVRQAIACAIDRDALIRTLWRGHAVPAETLLPLGAWAMADPATLAHYGHDTARAIALLDEAGLKPDRDGIRLRFTIKTSTDETVRLEAQAIQQQLRSAGIEMKIRSAEFGTFYSDITHGAFQMYILKWIGVNEDPDIFRYAYASTSFPPKGANRGRYANARVDALLAAAAVEPDQEVRRKQYAEVEQILSRDLPSFPLFYPYNEVVHSTRVTGIVLNPGGAFDFLSTAELH